MHDIIVGVILGGKFTVVEIVTHISILIFCRLEKCQMKLLTQQTRTSLKIKSSLLSSCTGASGSTTT